MNGDRMEGTARNMGGKLEEGFGRATGDVKSQAEGTVKQAVGAGKVEREPEMGRRFMTSAR